MKIRPKKSLGQNFLKDNNILDLIIKLGDIKSKNTVIIENDLEKDTIKHPRQTFENAELYLKQGLNSFQSLSISVPEDSYINSLKYKSTKLSTTIGILCKELQKHCYYLLYNLSLRFNKDFIDNPDIYKKEISLNTDNVSESNTFMKYELY